MIEEKIPFYYRWWGGPARLILGLLAGAHLCAKSLKVTTDAAGKIWFFAGTDSGFEATTTIYYTVVSFSLSP